MIHAGIYSISINYRVFFPVQVPGIDANHHRNALALLQLVNGSTSALVTDDQKPLHAELVVHINLISLQTGLHDSIVYRTSYGADLPIKTARRLACDAEIIPAVLDGHSVHLDVGRAKRLPTAGQRRALESMYQTCVVDGGDPCFHHCSIHHIKYSEMGAPPTSATCSPSVHGTITPPTRAAGSYTLNLRPES